MHEVSNKDSMEGHYKNKRALLSKCTIFRDKAFKEGRRRIGLALLPMFFILTYSKFRVVIEFA